MASGVVVVVAVIKYHFSVKVLNNQLKKTLQNL